MKEPYRHPLRRAVRRVRLGLPQVLGAARRRLGRHIHIVGVTGSAGKSTVTRLIARILASGGRLHEGRDINTPAGIRRTYLRAPFGCRNWVQEISGHEAGAVADSTRFVRPNIGVLLNIRDDHVKMFEGPEALAHGKGDLLEALPAHGCAVINADDPVVVAQSVRARCRVLTFGEHGSADVRVIGASAGLPGPLRVTVAHGDETVEVVAEFPSRRWATHVAAALATGIAAGHPLATCAARLNGAEAELYKDSIHRLEDGTIVVLDAFKASFWTLDGSFEALASAKAARKTFVLGTLSDYRGSPRSRYTEAAMGALAVSDRLIAYGPHAYRLKRLLPEFPGRLFLFDRYVDLAEFLDADAIAGEIIYVKATGSDHLERLMHRKRSPIACARDACGVALRSCNSCKRLYGRKLSRSEAAALR